MSSAGYIKLYRQLLDNPLMQDSRALHVFVWSLLRANYTSRALRFNGEEIRLAAGEFISGRFAGALECGLPPSTFRNAVERLRGSGMIATRSDNKKTIFTVVNWARFQSEMQAEDSKRTARGQQGDTDKKMRMEEQSPAFDTTAAFDLIWRNYPRREGRKDAFRHFKTSVKSEADFARIQTALANYKARIARERREPRFIQQGSRWFNNWPEWQTDPVQQARPLSDYMLSEALHAAKS